MASQKFNSFTFLFLAIIASVLSCGIAETKTNNFCKTAQDKDLCNTMVAGATNWHKAIENALKDTRSLAKELVSKSKLIAPALVNLQAGRRESIEKTCKESFETVIDMLNGGKIAVKADDKDTLQTMLSSALNTKCADEFSNAGATFPIANLAKELGTKVSICLAIATQN